mgnify:CR=1 FL=1
MMKFANNHPWLFRSWSQAFLVGFVQMIVAGLTELVNIVVVITSNTVLNVIMNFLALVIISEFDDQLFATVKNTFFAKAISEGTFLRQTTDTDSDAFSLQDLLRIRVTTSQEAKLKIPEHLLVPGVNDDLPEDPTAAVSELLVPETATKQLEGQPKYIYVDFWQDRAFSNKVGRVVYRLTHAFYVSFFFYFVPFGSLAMSYLFIKAEGSNDKPTD